MKWGKVGDDQASLTARQLFLIPTITSPRIPFVTPLIPLLHLLHHMSTISNEGKYYCTFIFRNPDRTGETKLLAITFDQDATSSSFSGSTNKDITL